MTAWATFSLGELGRIVTGRTPPSAQEHHFKGEIPFLTPTDIDGEHRDISTGRTVSADWDRQQSRIRLPARSVCVVCIGATIGKVCMTSTPSQSNQQINSIVVDESRFDPHFVYYRLRLMREEFKNRASGAATPILNKSSFSEIKIELPSRDVQRHVASILTAYDDLIEVNRRRIALLEEMTRRLFDEWFVYFRYPGHEDTPMIETPDGPLPNGWQHLRLDQIANVNISSIGPRSAPAVIGYVDIASVVRGEIQKIDPMNFADAPVRARRRVKDGSIIWSTVRPNLRSYALIHDPSENLVVSTGFAVLDARDVSPAFLYHHTTTEDFVGYLVGNATGAAYPAVTGAVFERASVLVPTKDVDRQFNSVAEPPLRLVSNLRAESVRLAAARNLLLPRLISGELSVSSAERELEAVG